MAHGSRALAPYTATQGGPWTGSRSMTGRRPESPAVGHVEALGGIHVMRWPTMAAGL